MRGDVFNGCVGLFMGFMALHLVADGGLKKLGGDGVPEWVVAAGIGLVFLGSGYSIYLGIYGDTANVDDSGRPRESVEHATARRAEQDAGKPPKITRGKIKNTMPPTPSKITGKPTTTRPDSED